MDVAPLSTIEGLQNYRGGTGKHWHPSYKGFTVSTIYRITHIANEKLKAMKLKNN